MKLAFLHCEALASERAGGRAECYVQGLAEGIKMATAETAVRSMFKFGSSFNNVYSAFGDTLSKEEILDIQRDVCKSVFVD